MNRLEFAALLEEKFPKTYACAWDNDGWMCAADTDSDVRRVLCTLDVTKEALRYAAENGFDTVLSHHPLIFHPLRSVTPSDPTAKKVLFALRQNISVFSFHTRFDAMPGGMNDLLAKKLGLTDLCTFGDAVGEIGRIGTLPQAVRTEDFCKTVRSTLGCDRLSYAKAGETAHRVAVVGGSGKDYIRPAMLAGADTFVSGELGYNHMAEAAETGMTLIEAGHFFTENIICGYYKDMLETLGLESACFYSNPVVTI